MEGKGLGFDSHMGLWSDLAVARHPVDPMAG